MPKRKRQANQLNPLAGVDSNRALARLRLTNAQWRKISNLSSIPKSMDEAREAIETALGMFLQFKAKECFANTPPKFEGNFVLLRRTLGTFTGVFLIY